MKKIICAAMCLMLSLSGCGMVGGKSGVSPEYQLFIEKELELRKEYYETLKAAPRAKIKLPAPGGKEYEFVTYDTPEWVPLQQEAPSEWAPVVRAGISQLGIIGGIYAVGSVAENILSAAAGATYNTGGGNVSQSNVGNSNVAAGSGQHGITGHENPTMHHIITE